MGLAINLISAVATVLLRKLIRKLSYKSVVVANQSPTFLSTFLFLIGSGCTICYFTRNKYRNWLSTRKNKPGTTTQTHRQCHLLYENPIVKAKCRLQNNSRRTPVVQNDANTTLHLETESPNSQPLDQITTIQIMSSDNSHRTEVVEIDDNAIPHLLRKSLNLELSDQIAAIQTTSSNDSNNAKVERDVSAIENLVGDSSNSGPSDQIAAIQTTNSNNSQNAKVGRDANAIVNLVGELTNSELSNQLATTQTTSTNSMHCLHSKEQKSEKSFRRGLRRRSALLNRISLIINDDPTLISKTRSGTIYGVQNSE